VCFEKIISFILSDIELRVFGILTKTFGWVVESAFYASIGIFLEEFVPQKASESTSEVDSKYFNFCRKFSFGVVKTAFYVTR